MVVGVSALRSEGSSSVARGGQEGRSSGGVGVAWRGNVRVTQMSSKDTVDRQSEAHELRNGK